MPSLDQEILEIKSNGLNFSLPNGAVFTAQVEKEVMSMCDGKMIVRLLQLGGSYCTMCHHSQSQCHDETLITAGFKITRSVESIRDLALSLYDPESEEIKRAPNDYEQRQGITGLPITTADVTTVLPVCHAKIHAFDWIVNRLMVKANSHQKWHSAATPVRYTAEEKAAEKVARENLQQEIRNCLGLIIGDPSEMITGNRFKTFCSDSARDKLANLLNDSSLRDAFKEIHIGLCAIIRVLNSQHRIINVPEYQNLCTSVYLKICKSFPWAIVSPSLHRVLAHSWERIELNDAKGLGSESEEGSEAQNKYIRFLRVHGSRKTSTEDNFKDTWNHLWRRSSPMVIELNREKKRRAAKVVVHNEIDSLVESLFCN